MAPRVHTSFFRRQEWAFEVNAGPADTYWSVFTLTVFDDGQISIEPNNQYGTTPPTLTLPPGSELA